MNRTIQDRAAARAWRERHEPDAPRVGDQAPDFELSDPSGSMSERLSNFRGERPVVLVFGSFT
jgi:hypothetical protein